MIASDLNKGKFFEYKDEILQVTRKGLVSVGTHSHTKLVITAVDLNGKKERTITMAHNDKVNIIDIMKKKASIISISGNIILIMDIFSYETLEASAEKSVLKTLNEGDEIAYVDYKGIKILGKKKN